MLRGGFAEIGAAKRCMLSLSLIDRFCDRSFLRFCGPQVCSAGSGGTKQALHNDDLKCIFRQRRGHEYPSFADLLCGNTRQDEGPESDPWQSCP